LLDVDSAGNLFYLAGLESRGRRLQWFETSGQESSTNLASDLYRNPRISPDGRRFVVGVGRVGVDGTQVGRNQIRVVDVARGLPLDLDTGGVDPIWGPNDTITFAEGWPDRRLSQVSSDNSSQPEQLLDSPDSYLSPQDWSPDGSRLVFASRAAKASRGSVNNNLSVLVSGTDPKPLLDSPADETNGRISPDGNWLAYQSTALGRTRIYVRPFDRPGGTRTVSGEGGGYPVWARDGSALFFLEKGKLMKAPVDYSPFTIGAATSLFSLPVSTESFDVGPDGRFLVVLGSTGNDADELRVILGWKTSARR